MSGLVIYINWEYFLGLLGVIIGLAYYANGRFTKLETSVEWLKDALRELQIDADNRAIKLFSAGSPVSLTRMGKRILNISGLKSYIDMHKDELLKSCCTRLASDPYEFQACAFRVVATTELDQPYEQQLREIAFSYSLSLELLRRVGAIYLRDIAKDRH